jgi:hypothetical protein
MVICIIPLSGRLSTALTDETRVGAKSCGFIEDLLAQRYAEEYPDRHDDKHEGRTKHQDGGHADARR